MTPTLSRRAMAELLGTFLLVFLSAGAVVMAPFPDAKFGLIGIAITYGLTLSVVVSMTMAISGGVVNPAITVGLWSVGKLNSRDAAVYGVSQIAGAAIAALALKTLLPANVAALRSIAYGLPTVYTTLTTTQAIIIEAVLTFILMSVFMATIISTKAPKLGGFGVGLAMIPLIFVGGPLTGAALNPARALGPALASGEGTAQIVWWIGPIIGAVIAAQLWGRFLLKEE